MEQKEELKKWFDKAIEDKEAYLKNTALFRIMGSECIVQGRRIYQHKKTKQYWYLDNLHKNHFEVFNKEKEHLGEADLSGNLDMTKKDESKNKKLPSC